MQALAASRLISADFPTLVGVLAFQIEQRTSGEIGKKEYKHNCFFSCQLAPLIFFPLRLWIPLTCAKLGLRNFVILLVSLSTQPSDQLGVSLQLFNFSNTIVLSVAQTPFLLHILEVPFIKTANKLQVGTVFSTMQ